MKLVAGARKSSEPQAFEAVMRLEVCETDLDLLSLIARFEDRFRLHLTARQVAGVLVHIAHDPARGDIRAAPPFECARTAGEHRCRVADPMIGTDMVGNKASAPATSYQG
jgi:hypothetical protein